MANFKNLWLFMAVQLKDNRILKYAAQLAYSVLLAFIPFIMLFNALISWVYVDLNNWVVTKLLGILPDVLGPFVETAGSNLPGEGASIPTLLIFGLLILYFSVYALRSFVITTTKVMGIHESRNYFVLWWVGFLYLIVIITLSVFFLILYFLAESIVKTNALSFLPAQYLVNLWHPISMLLLLVFFVLMMSLLYSYALPHQMRFADSLPGSLFVSLLWIALSIVYKYCTGFFTDFTLINVFFVAPFSYIIMIYFLCLAFVCGSVVNLYFINIRRKPHEVSRLTEK